MGFGYLLYGFMMLVEVGLTVNAQYSVGIDIFPDLAGYLFMLAAARRLSDYSEYFEKFKISLYPLILLGGVEFALQITAAFVDELGVISNVLNIAGNVQYPFQMIALVFALKGIHSLAVDTEDEKIEKRSTVAMTMCVCYYPLTIFIILAREFKLVESFASAFNAISICANLLWYIFVIYSIALVFRCYMYICKEGDENMDSPRGFDPLGALYRKLKK